MVQRYIPEPLLEGEFLIMRYGATLADYYRAANEDTRLDLLNGVLVMHSPANVRHEDAFAFLLTLLRGYVIPRRLGRVLGSRTPMVLEDETRFEPDLMFIAARNLAQLGETNLMGPADLVIEILSPATRAYDQGQKRDAYAQGGVPEYWLVDPAKRVLLVDRPAGTRVATLSAGRCETPALPGFWLEVGWLWQEPLPDAAQCLEGIGGKGA